MEIGPPAYETAIADGQQACTKCEAISSTDSTLETFPRDGQIYIIREKASKRMIGLRNGQVQLYSVSEGKKELSDFLNDPSCHWRCERNGWVKFCNVTSGTYLGGNYVKERKLELPGEKLVVQPKLKRGYPCSACFSLEYDPRGGFVLLVFHRDNKCYITLNQVRVKKDGNGLILDKADEEDRTLWNFIKV